MLDYMKIFIKKIFNMIICGKFAVIMLEIILTLKTTRVWK